MLFPRMQPGPRTTRDGSPSVPAAAAEQRGPGFPGSGQAHPRAVLAAVPPVSRPAAAAVVVVSIKLGPSLRLCSVFQSSTAVDSEHTNLLYEENDFTLVPMLKNVKKFFLSFFN